MATPEKVESLLRNINALILKYLGCLCFLFTIGMAIIVLIGIITRYFLQYAVPWTEEASRYLMIWMVFMAAPIALDKAAHVGLKILSDRLRGNAMFVNNLIGAILVIVFLLVCIYEGIDIAWFSRAQRLPTLPISQFWIYLSIPLGCAIMLSVVIQNLLGSFRERLSGRPKEPGL